LVVRVKKLLVIRFGPYLARAWARRASAKIRGTKHPHAGGVELDFG
jgi:hypothetical protein